MASECSRQRCVCAHPSTALGLAFVLPHCVLSHPHHLPGVLMSVSPLLVGLGAGCSALGVDLDLGSLSWQATCGIDFSSLLAGPGLGAVPGGAPHPSSSIVMGTGGSRGSDERDDHLEGQGPLRKPSWTVGAGWDFVFFQE